MNHDEKWSTSRQNPVVRFDGHTKRTRGATAAVRDIFVYRNIRDFHDLHNNLIGRVWEMVGIPLRAKGGNGWMLARALGIIIDGARENEIREIRCEND